MTLPLCLCRGFDVNVIVLKYFFASDAAVPSGNDKGVKSTTTPADTNGEKVFLIFIKNNLSKCPPRYVNPMYLTNECCLFVFVNMLTLF